MRFIDAAEVAALGPAAAVQAITDALQRGLDPRDDAARVTVPLTHGQFLLMPSETTNAVGVKVVTVAPDNPTHDLPRIQAAYLLFDQRTLALRAVLDGTALTTLRTPAVSVAAILPHLPQRPLRVVIIGAGPQALAHTETLRAVRDLDSVTYVVREPSRCASPALRLGDPDANNALRAAHVVVCATSARTPLFDGSLIADDATVIAVGSHESDARELDSALLGRSTVVVEDVTAALREAGDVVMAIAEGALGAGDLRSMRDVVTGVTAIPSDRPLVFKSVGMSWEDLVIAEAVVARH